MIRNMKIVLMLIFLLFSAVKVFASTVVEGLNDALSDSYCLTLEISGNDPRSDVIEIYPVNYLQIRHIDSSKNKNEDVFKGPISAQDYKLIYEKACHAIENFKVLDTPNLVADATHYMLSLAINSRQISIKYSSVVHIKEISPNYSDILEAVNKYLPEDKKFKF